jgi:hypothetical protein
MKLTIAIALASLSLAGSAMAQDKPSDEALTPRQACRADHKALCAGKRGRDAMMCLRENGKNVSEPCREAMQKHRLRQGPHPD